MGPDRKFGLAQLSRKHILSSHRQVGQRQPALWQGFLKAEKAWKKAEEAAGRARQLAQARQNEARGALAVETAVKRRRRSLTMAALAPAELEAGLAAPVAPPAAGPAPPHHG